MESRILDAIKKYKISDFATYAIILYAIHYILYYIWINYFKETISMPHLSDDLIRYGIGLLFFLLWCFSFFTFLRKTVYAEKTGGRLYQKDKVKFRRSYHELVDYFHDADPCKLDITTLPICSWQDSNGVILGAVENRLISKAPLSPGNISICGQPGIGKTTCIIINTALQFGGSVFAIDVKGDISAVTRQKRNIKFFAPADPQNSCTYDPLSGAKEMAIDDRKKLIQTIAFIIIPEVHNDGKYFADGARDYFTGISLFLINKYNASFPVIVTQILHGNAFCWVKDICASNCLEAKEYVSSYFGQNEKNICGCYGALCQAVRPFHTKNLSSLLLASDNSISVDDLECGTDIYLEINQDELKIYAPLLTIIVQQFLIAFTRRREQSGCPILMLLDEFPQLQRMDISSALATLRSKRVSLLIAYQSLSQLDNIYGISGRKEIFDTITYFAILGVQDPETRKMFSDLIGSKKVLKISNAIGNNSKRSGKTVQESREPVFLPESFGNLENKLIIYSNGKYVLADKTPYYR